MSGWTISKQYQRQTEDDKKSAAACPSHTVVMAAAVMVGRRSENTRDVLSINSSDVFICLCVRVQPSTTEGDFERNLWQSQ